MNILVCEAEQEVVDIVPSVDVIVAMLQPSVAVAEPSAAVISAVKGLQPRETSAYDPVNVGGTRSVVHVTTEEAVALLPQPSEALNVLVCEAEHPLDCTGPSVTVTDGVPQAAVAVAEPKAALISAAEGLQPSVGVAPVIIIVGGLGAFVQVTVLVIVAELPQASVAINVLVSEALHDVVDTVPSVEVIVAVLQPSVAEAEPSAAVISAVKGLQPSGTSL